MHRNQLCTDIIITPSSDFLNHVPERISGSPLELEEVHGSPNLPSHSEDERMTLEVEFRLWFNYKNHPLHRVRFVFDKNASIEEASRTAFQKCIGKVPDEFYMFIAKGNNEVWAIGDKDEKISSVVHEGERLLLSDVHDYLLRNSNRILKPRYNVWNSGSNCSYNQYICVITF